VGKPQSVLNGVSKKASFFMGKDRKGKRTNGETFRDISKGAAHGETVFEEPWFPTRNWNFASDHQKTPKKLRTEKRESAFNIYVENVEVRANSWCPFNFRVGNFRTLPHGKPVCVALGPVTGKGESFLVVGSTRPSERGKLLRRVRTRRLPGDF